MKLTPQKVKGMGLPYGEKIVESHSTSWNNQRRFLHLHILL